MWIVLATPRGTKQKKKPKVPTGVDLHLKWN